MDGVKEVKHFYKNGKIFLHCFYDQGNLHSEYKLYNESGHLDIHCFYDQGRFHGEYKCRYENGQLEEHCFFNQGQLHGECKLYSKNGQIIKHCFYDQGNEVDVSDYLEDPNNPTEADIVTLSLMFNGNVIVLNEPSKAPSRIKALLQKWLNKISLMKEIF